VSDDNQFHQYQLNNRSILTPNHWTQERPWCMCRLKFKSLVEQFLNILFQ
jgi:hypothetical protein